MIPSELNNYWKNYNNNLEQIIVFYSHNNGEYKCFSNFYTSTFDYKIKHGIFKDKIFSVEFAEKAIMLSKASIMNDTETFSKILNAKTPLEAKKLGREVKPFDQDIWDKNICNIAEDICLSKFSQNSNLKDILLSTGNKIIAEASPRDKIWGIGIGSKNPNTQNKTEWKGTNILGWALMEARESLNKKDNLSIFEHDSFEDRNIQMELQKYKEDY
jgi:ribA/ribD-fused uncharacterized protein